MHKYSAKIEQTMKFYQKIAIFEGFEYFCLFCPSTYAMNKILMKTPTVSSPSKRFFLLFPDMYVE